MVPNCKRRTRTIFLALEYPLILSSLSSYIGWDDFYALLNSCKDCRLLFEHTALRDVILSRYVPWYAHALRLRDPQLRGYKDVPVSLKDLDLLLTSQRVPLHQYPIHARRALTSQSSSTVISSTWLESLTHAHSRFVLLLQAYVHSSNDALRAESEDALWLSPSEAPSRLRRLIFPRPLSYCAGNESRSLGPNGTAEQGQNSINVSRSSRGRPDESVRAASAVLPSKKSRTFSFLSRSSSKYLATQTCSNSWKRSSIMSQLSRDTDYISDEGWSPSSSHRLAQPVVPKVRSSDSFPCSGSGSSSSPRSTSLGSLFPLTATNSSSGSITGSSSIVSPSFRSRPQSVVHQLFSSGHTSYPMRMTSPLDISFAVSRSRSPILRVFIPSSDNQDPSHELLSCEQQLMDAGLWDHLSAGDLICNLGYVAAEGDEAGVSFSASSDGDLGASHQRDALRRSENRQKRRSTSFICYQGPTHSRRWLLFNGRFLEPHKPPQAIRIPDPLSLPTPFYYMHIMPPYTNPVYTIDGLGFQDIDTIQLRVVHSFGNMSGLHGCCVLQSFLITMSAWGRDSLVMDG